MRHVYVISLSMNRDIQNESESDGRRAEKTTKREDSDAEWEETGNSARMEVTNPGGNSYSTGTQETG